MMVGRLRHTFSVKYFTGWNVCLCVCAFMGVRFIDVRTEAVPQSVGGGFEGPVSPA